MLETLKSSEGERGRERRNEKVGRGRKGREGRERVCVCSCVSALSRAFICATLIIAVVVGSGDVSFASDASNEERRRRFRFCRFKTFLSKLKKRNRSQVERKSRRNIFLSSRSKFSKLSLRFGSEDNFSVSCRV